MLAVPFPLPDSQGHGSPPGPAASGQEWAGHQLVLREGSAGGEGQVAGSAKGRGGRGRREAWAREATRDAGSGASGSLTHPSRPAGGQRAARGDAAAQGARLPATHPARGGLRAQQPLCPHPAAPGAPSGGDKAEQGRPGRGWAHVGPPRSGVEGASWPGRHALHLHSDSSGRREVSPGLLGQVRLGREAWRGRGLRTRCADLSLHARVLSSLPPQRGRLSNDCPEPHGGPSFRGSHTTRGPGRDGAGACRGVWRGAYGDPRLAPEGCVCPARAQPTLRSVVAGLGELTHALFF